MDRKRIRAVAARPKGKYDTLCLFSRPRPPDLEIPGAFGSEITKGSSDDEALRWHRGHRVVTDFLHPSAGESGSIPAANLTQLNQPDVIRYVAANNFTLRGGVLRKRQPKANSLRVLPGNSTHPPVTRWAVEESDHRQPGERRRGNAVSRQ